MQDRALVTGAAGFIGGHLCNFLKAKGYWVRGVDWHAPQYGLYLLADEVDWQCDLRYSANAHRVVEGINDVWALAANMGGMGFIMKYHYTILRDNLAIAINTADAAMHSGVRRLFFTSSACVYPVALQETTEARNLTEADAWQGIPESAYGAEKLIAEQLYERLARETGITVRTARFHNIFGPNGAWNPDKERAKAPAALCAKAAMAKRAGINKINVWGDGEQTRTFCYIDDCLEMMWRLMHSDYPAPMNIGTDCLVTINELALMAAECAGLQDVELVHELDKPQGVRGRNADLSLMRAVLQYEPQISLEEGLARTYKWVEAQI